MEEGKKVVIKNFIINGFKHPLEYLGAFILWIGCKLYKLITGKEPWNGM
jgi:hypothetical protein